MTDSVYITQSYQSTKQQCILIMGHNARLSVMLTKKLLHIRGHLHLVNVLLSYVVFCYWPISLIFLAGTGVIMQLSQYLRVNPWGHLLITTANTHKSHNAPVSYPTMHHSEQKCAIVCPVWCMVGYGTGAFRDLLTRSFTGVWTRWTKWWMFPHLKISANKLP